MTGDDVKRQLHGIFGSARDNIHARGDATEPTDTPGKLPEVLTSDAGGKLPQVSTADDDPDGGEAPAPLPATPATGSAPFAAVKARAVASPVEVYRAAGVDLRPDGLGGLSGACPLPGHVGPGPITVSPSTGRWKCRPCHAHGDAADLHGMVAGVGLREAAFDLARRLALAGGETAPGETGDDPDGEAVPDDDQGGEDTGGEAETPATAPQPTRIPGPPYVDCARAYATSVLTGRVAKLRKAPVPARALWVALRDHLAKFAGWRWLSTADLDPLLDEAVSRGLSEAEIGKAMTGGLGAFKAEHKPPKGSPRLARRPVWCGRMRRWDDDPTGVVRCGLGADRWVHRPALDGSVGCPERCEDWGWCPYQGWQGTADGRTSNTACGVWLAAPRCGMRSGRDGCHLLDTHGSCAFETPQHECRMLGKPGPCRRRQIGWCALVDRSTGKCRLDHAGRCMALWPACELLDDSGCCKVPPTGGGCKHTTSDGLCKQARPGPVYPRCVLWQSDATCLLDGAVCVDVVVSPDECRWRVPEVRGWTAKQGIRRVDLARLREAVTQLAVPCGDDTEADPEAVAEPASRTCVPAVPLVVAGPLCRVLRRGNRSDPGDDGEAVLVDHRGRHVCDLVVPVGCLDMAPTEALLTATQTAALSSLDGHRALRLVILRLAEQLAADVPEARVLQFTGYEDFARQAGCRGTDAAQRIRDVLRAGQCLSFRPAPGHEVNGLWLSESWDRTRRRSLRVEVSRYLHCAVAHELPQGERRLVPWPNRLPPLVGRPGCHAPQAALQVALFVSLVETAPVVAERGAFSLLGRVERMRERSALPRKMLAPVLEAWRTGMGDPAAAMIVDVGGGLCRLAPAYQAEWRFIVEGGRKILDGRTDRSRFVRRDRPREKR